jgi:hypothetical protein
MTSHSKYAGQESIRSGFARRLVGAEIDRGDEAGGADGREERSTTQRQLQQ